MTLRMSAAIAVLFVFGPATAQDSGEPGIQSLYESMDDIRIGRVFLDPKERRALDERRANPVVAGSTGNNVAAPLETGRKARRPAGFIIRGSGDALHWRDGDFVHDSASETTSAVSFPGDIAITRHVAKPEPSGRRPADDGSTKAGPEGHENIEQGTR